MPSGQKSLAQHWCVFSLLHDRVLAQIERALTARFELSAREFLLLDVLSHQHEGKGGHLPMKKVAEAVVLSQSATTRLVTRLEERRLLSRFLCPSDRRGIYTNVTPAGRTLLEEARTVHHKALKEALEEARNDLHLRPLVQILENLDTSGYNFEIAPPSSTRR